MAMDRLCDLPLAFDWNRIEREQGFNAAALVPAQLPGKFRKKALPARYGVSAIS